jgi:hemerythrin superfamily protein
MIDALLVHKNGFDIFKKNRRLKMQRVLKEIYESLTDKSLSEEERTRLIQQASEMTKIPTERSEELETLIYKIRRLMMGYTD